MRGTTAVLRTVSVCTSAWTSQGPQSIARVKSRPRAAPAILAAWHLRGYQHSSEHAPATSLRSAGGDDGSGDDATYSRWSLMSAWHRAARQLTPAEVAWEERDTVDVQHVVIQADGTVERPDSRLHKRDLIRKYGLLPRDLRALDAHVLDVRPALLVTKRSIVLCTPIFRAVLSHDRLLVIPADLKNPICSDDGANELVEAVRETMSHLNFGGSASNKDSLPFELRALEALLIITVRGFKTVTAELSGRVYETIPQLRLGVSPAELKNLMEAKRTCEDALLAGRAFQSALSAVLNSDEDMAAMYLTDRVQGNIRNVEEHETVELILEHMERRIDEANEAALRLQSLLNDVDANLSLVLQSTRVKLQNLELQTAIAALGVASATLVGGFFGMNLVNGYEDHPTAFNWATSGSCGLMAMIIAIGYIRLVRNRRSQLFLRAYIKAKPENLKEIQRGRMGNLDTRSGQASTLTVSRKEYEKKVERVEKERKEAEQRLDEKEKREKAEKGESTQNEKSSPADEQKDGTQI